MPPWQGWEPDSNFLYELHKWNIAHKDDKLPAVLTKVNSVLESKPLQAALEFIPNNPFPAKSLVKAMVSLFLLGSVSDVSKHIPCYLPILIISYRKFLRRSRTSITFRIRWLLISLVWPKYLVWLEVVSCRRKLGKICKRLGGYWRTLSSDADYNINNQSYSGTWSTKSVNGLITDWWAAYFASRTVLCLTSIPNTRN